MFNPLRELRDWNRHQRLAFYPQLQIFGQDEAWKRLEKYEQEELAKYAPWPRVLKVLQIVLVTAWFIASRFAPDLLPWVFLAMFPPIIPFIFFHRGLGRRVAAKVAAELGTGRLAKCVECNYDLRGSPTDRCPECGASIIITPP